MQELYFDEAEALEAAVQEALAWDRYSDIDLNALIAYNANEAECDRLAEMEARKVQG
jgi:hypothetical protein